MTIKQGGSTKNISGDKVTTIKANKGTGRTCELWINDSLSYLTINELLDLKEELNDVIEKIIHHEQR